MVEDTSRPSLSRDEVTDEDAMRALVSVELEIGITLEVALWEDVELVVLVKLS